jgi:hypothetical protein
MQQQPEVFVYPSRVEQQRDEPAYGLLVRTATHNGAIRPYSVFRRFGASGGMGASTVSLEDVALACKADAEALRRSTPDLNPDTATVLGETLDRRHFSCQTKRWCPHCLEEAPYHRVWWDLVPITTCPVHEVDLVDRCDCDAPLRTVMNFVDQCRRGHSLKAVEAPKAPEKSLAVDGYLLGRMLGSGGKRIQHLDDTILQDVITLCESLGRELIAPEEKFNRTRSGNARRAFMAEGFANLADLNTAFPSALDRLAARDHRANRKWGLEKTYGRFYIALVQMQESALRSAILDAIAKHAAPRTPIKSGQVMGRDATNTDAVTLVQCAEMCGLTFERFRRVAVALEMMPRTWGQGTPFYIDRAKAEELARRLDGHKDLKTIAEELGVTETAAVKLADEGFVEFIVHGGGNAKGLNKWIFHRDGASNLLTKLDALIPGDLQTGDHLVYLARAGQIAYSSVAKMVRLILEGKLSIRGIDENAVGLERLLVSKAETQRAVRQERAPGLTQNELCDLVRLPFKVVASFVQGGIIASKKVGRVITVSEEEANRFLDTYITVPNLCREVGRNRREVDHLLEKSGVQPTASRPKFVQVLYEKEAALKVFRYD